jgi:hypothetical protein
MSVPESEAQLKAFATAGQVLNQWYLGAQALALLRAAHAAGVLMTMREARSVTEFAARTGLSAEWVADLCAALYVLGVVDEAARAGTCCTSPFSIRR